MKNSTGRFIYLFTYLFFFIFSLTLPAQTDIQAHPTDIFSADSIVNVWIITDMDSLLSDMDNDVRQWPAKIRYELAPGHLTTFSAKISTRGKFRRKTSNCDFPPLRLAIPRDADTLLFNDITNIRIVTHCRNQSKEFSQYAMAEYLVYRIWNVLSENAFQVRPVRFTYVNTGSEFSVKTNLGFFLESMSHFEKRMNVREVKMKELKPDKLDQEQYKILCLFQYMISNNDWAPSILHNIRVVRPNKYDPPLAVPFDFDWSGIIGIPYTVPSVTDNKTLVVEREFKGNFKRRKELKPAIKYFRSKRKEIQNLVIEFPYLDQPMKDNFLNHINEFYSIINSPLATKALMLKRK